jgi:hypothetical protein
MEEVHTFSAGKAIYLLRRARKAAEFPYDEIEYGWANSVVDPMQLLPPFKSLRLREGMILRAYQVYGGFAGKGFVYAVPEKAPFPEPEEWGLDLRELFYPPAPPGALDNVMEAIEGDGTPWSYLSASLLARELAEFGAFWHACNWSTHEIMDEKSFIRETIRFTRELSRDSSDPCDIEPEIWEWLEPKPEEWDPFVKFGDDFIIVSFYSFNEFNVAGIYRHVDGYNPGSYNTVTSEEIRITCGPGRGIF